MKNEKTYVLAWLVIALLASIPQIPVDAGIWGAILVVIGIVGGAMVNYPDLTMRVLIYVLAVALPMFSNALDYIPMVGAWLNGYLDHVATGIQGMAIGLVVMGLLAARQIACKTPLADAVGGWRFCIRPSFGDDGGDTRPVSSRPILNSPPELSAALPPAGRRRQCRSAPKPVPRRRMSQ